MKTVIAILGAFFCVFLAVMLYRDYRAAQPGLQSDASIGEEVRVNHRPAWIGLSLMVFFVVFGILCLLFSLGLLDDIVVHLTGIKTMAFSAVYRMNMPCFYDFNWLTSKTLCLTEYH